MTGLEKLAAVVDAAFTEAAPGWRINPALWWRLALAVPDPEPYGLCGDCALDWRGVRVQFDRRRYPACPIDAPQRVPGSYLL